MHAPKAQNEKPVHATKQKVSLADDSSSTPSLESMEREVIELEKQIQRHMAAREKALVRVSAATAKCGAADAACNQAHTEVNWKISKDKYEQAAMNDILKDDKKPNTEEEGQALFNRYASQAEQLSGLHSLQTLNNETTEMVHQHILAEHQSLHALRAAEQKLDSLKMAERKMQDAKQAEIVKAAISKTQQHMNQQLEKMSVGSRHKIVVSAAKERARDSSCSDCGPNPSSDSSAAGASSDTWESVPSPSANAEVSEDETQGAVLSPSSSNPTDVVHKVSLTSETGYQHDFAQAQHVEALRRKAFLNIEKQLESKVLAVPSS
jgi:hypothetical protein